MKLSVTKRAETKKSDTKKFRREGLVPAVIYSPGKQCELILINGTEFATVLREMKPGQLPTTIFTLNMGNKEIKAIVKDIQYNLTSYQVIHLDFEELVDTIPVSVKVPVNCIGIADCPGIKLGGFLRQVIRHVKVETLPKNIPAEFLVDVKDLGIRQAKRVSDLPMPKGVRPLAPMEEVVVVIAKR